MSGIEKDYTAILPKFGLSPITFAFEYSLSFIINPHQHCHTGIGTIEIWLISTPTLRLKMLIVSNVLLYC